MPAKSADDQADESANRPDRNSHCVATSRGSSRMQLGSWHKLRYDSGIWIMWGIDGEASQAEDLRWLWRVGCRRCWLRPGRGAGRERTAGVRRSGGERGRRFLRTMASQPIWFRGGVTKPAVAQLIAILQRAPFDGFAAGSAARRQVQAAAAQAASGKPADVAAAEQRAFHRLGRNMSRRQAADAGHDLRLSGACSRRARAPTRSC